MVQMWKRRQRRRRSGGQGSCRNESDRLHLGEGCSQNYLLEFNHPSISLLRMM
jgi:hypothetical protein